MLSPFPRTSHIVKQKRGDLSGRPKAFANLLRLFVCASMWHKISAISKLELTPVCGSESVPKLAANLRVHWCHAVLPCFAEVKKRFTIIVFVALLRHRLGGLCID